MKGLTSPEGVLMLCVAGLLDVVGFVLLCFSWAGVDDYGIVDIIGGAIIGGWMLLRYSAMGSEGGMKEKEESEEENEEKPDIELPQKDKKQTPENKLPESKNANLPTGNKKGTNIKNPKGMAGQEEKNLGKKTL